MLLQIAFTFLENVEADNVDLTLQVYCIIRYYSFSVADSVDECAQELHNCHPNATCTNQPYDLYTDDGSPFLCICKPGFEGDGYFCQS